ncbi:MAG: thermonuclease family protein [Erythrobacter sp.]|jgi:endonuclease YncB( thermonuclease family)|nr:thermonuclease family protein [Erythrobacter sp.]
MRLVNSAVRAACSLAIIGSALSLAAPPAAAETVSGEARVVDGDSLEVAGRRIRLFGIDAPEGTQKCERSGERWACGEASAEQLKGLIGTDSVICEGNERDVYGRLLAVCRVAGVDLNRMMVAGGWATAFRRYSEDYVAEEMRARAAKTGLWASNFMAPEDYRRTADAEEAPKRARETARPAPVQKHSACAIKGNRSRRGDWIYHLPGMPYYNETRAEEMFCSEAEAVAAGYRKSRAGN